MPTVTDATTIALLIQYQAVMNALKPLEAQEKALRSELISRLKPDDMAQTGDGYWVKCHAKPKYIWPNERLADLTLEQLRPFANLTKKPLDAGLKSGLLQKKWVDKVLKTRTVTEDVSLEFSKP
jgi:hypothetical protein